MGERGGGERERERERERLGSQEYIYTRNANEAEADFSLVSRPSPRCLRPELISGREKSWTRALPLYQLEHGVSKHYHK